MATSDIYTHLSVARHLSQGDGFVTDVTYPLSFAYPFAQQLPQPLIHRQPGFAILLQIPFATAGGDDHLTLTHVRHMQFVIMGMIIFVGAMGYFRRGKGPALLPWIIFLLASPLLNYAIDWGFVELVCALLLLAIWLRGRDVGNQGAGPIDGLLMGLLAMLRLDLFWVPLLWFFLWRRDKIKSSPGLSFFNSRLLGAIVVFILVMAPWTWRNIQVTGQPFFSLQAQAELVKMTPDWPGYSVYKHLEPQPLLQTMKEHPGAVLNKVVHGLGFFLKKHHQFMPWMLFWAGAIPAALFAFNLVLDELLLVVFRQKKARISISPARSAFAPSHVGFMTLALLCLQYSFFDHDLRHLIVMLPLILWEITLVVGESVEQIARRNTASWHTGINPLRTGLTGVVMAIILVFLWPCQLPEWKNAAKVAHDQQSMVKQRIASVRASRKPILFEETSAVPWYVNQPAVWSPADEKIRNKITEILSQK
jgi:hypothetical protein